jgi:hypothetical protein
LSNIFDFLKKENLIAVVGASNDKSKYGNRVYLDLKKGGFKIIPINLKEKQIEGDKTYAYLKDYKGKIDVICLVVKPEVSIQILQQALAMQIKNIWFQPGSENDECLEFAKDHGFNIVHGQCIMVERVKALN